MPAPRPLAELLQQTDRTDPYVGDDFLTALLFRPRPEVDQDRFTAGLQLTDLSDPLPVLF